MIQAYATIKVIQRNVLAWTQQREIALINKYCRENPDVIFVEFIKWTRKLKY